MNSHPLTEEAAGGWTSFEDRRFKGETLLAALQAARQAL
jgi:hypothetical protein